MEIVSVVRGRGWVWERGRGRKVCFFIKLCRLEVSKGYFFFLVEVRELN